MMHLFWWTLGISAILGLWLLEQYLKHKQDKELAADHIQRMKAMIAAAPYKAEPPRATWPMTPSPKLARFQQRVAEDRK